MLNPFLLQEPDQPGGSRFVWQSTRIHSQWGILRGGAAHGAKAQQQSYW